MEKVVEPLSVIVKLNSRLFLNCLDGVDEEAAGRRINKQVNNIAFIAVHAADARIFLANYLGCSVENPFWELAGARGIDDVKELPSIDVLRVQWKKATSALMERLSNLSDKELGDPSPENFPVDNRTKLGGFAFMLQHESFHIGQMALLRKYFGFPAMSYSEKKSDHG